MADFVLSTCSTADMPAAWFTARNIPYIPFRYHMDGSDYPDDLGQTMSFPDFYARIAAGSTAMTSQVGTAQFIGFFEPFLSAGQDIIHISLSSGISGTYGSACLARDELREKYPERKIFVVDSLAASAGCGLLADAAADVRAAGASVDETNAWLEANKLRLHHWFFVTDLTYLRRGGRVSATAAFVGNLLNICPILNINNEGKLIPRAKERGRKRVVTAMLEKMKNHADAGTDYNGKCFISHSVNPEDAGKLAALAAEAFPRLAAPVSISNIGAVIGAHTGPGTVALFFFGDERAV
ncbi:MAG: DegV family protein [Gracilibacteraceae bacterium]|jgi:DegV family protein with EDD domain|nr:DegV family protein [Gracilibacteraceae bacterium]